MRPLPLTGVLRMRSSCACVYTLPPSDNEFTGHASGWFFQNPCVNVHCSVSGVEYVACSRVLRSVHAAMGAANSSVATTERSFELMCMGPPGSAEALCESHTDRRVFDLADLRRGHRSQYAREQHALLRAHATRFFYSCAR